MLPRLIRDLCALFVQQYGNIATDTQRRAGLSAIAEHLVLLLTDFTASVQLLNALRVLAGKFSVVFRSCVVSAVVQGKAARGRSR